MTIADRSARRRLASRIALASLVLACGQAPARQEASGPRFDANGRKVLNGEPTDLAFKQVTVEQLLPFIVQATGKVVMPQQDVLSRRITVVNDRKIPLAQALDMVLLALQQNGIAVVETATTITLRDIAEITRQDVPVFGPDESVLGRTDYGTIAQKVFRLRYSTAENYKDTIKDALPDYAKVTIDKESNQFAVMGNISLLQRLERLVRSLDQPPAGAMTTETFRLRFADAAQIKTNIEELFSDSTRARAGQQRAQQNQNQRQPFVFPGQQQPQQPASSSGEIRVSANTQQNSVTVVADPAIIEQVRRQIEDYWDKPLPDEAVVPKIYDLKNSDPVKVRDLLEGLFGRGTSGTGASRPAGQGQAQTTAPSESQGVGRLAGQFSFQALPESGRLVVVAKSPDNLAVIDKIIEDLDQPQTIGLPAIVELKHASAEDLAEQINTLLAQDGTLAQIRRSESGLSESTTTASPFAQDAATTQNQTAQQQDQTTTTNMISFWWQRSRPPTDRANASNLVGQIRIVPVWRQNALMVLAPQEYKHSIVTLVEELDKPGRQVLIAAIVLEMSTDDATALGLRWSSQAITPLNADNSISIGANATGTQNDFLRSLFDTSVLNANVDLNVLLQALSQKTRVNILSEPRVFTGDNQEAEFFSGQDIPFITESQPNNQGNLLQSFDYRAVGIALRVRPRVTPRHEVDLRVNLELSAVVPGQTLFGGAIVDRRETTTQVIIKSGQTVVISGIHRVQDTNTVRKVPILGDIPILGALFRSIEKGKANTEVMAFITPIVVDNADDAGDVSRPFREQLDNRRRELGDPAPTPAAPPQG